MVFFVLDDPMLSLTIDVTVITLEILAVFIASASATGLQLAVRCFAAFTSRANVKMICNIVNIVGTRTTSYPRRVLSREAPKVIEEASQ